MLFTSILELVIKEGYPFKTISFGMNGDVCYHKVVYAKSKYECQSTLEFKVE